MNKNVMLAGMAVVGVIMLGAGAVVYKSWFGEPAAPSGPAIATPLSGGSSEAVANAAPSASMGSVQADAPTGVPDSAAPQVAVPAAPTASPRLYRIAQDASQVRFNIFEELRGQPKDVIGTSSQVAGEVSVDLANLASTRVGEIRVNARTFVTDDERRNRAIQNRILETEAHEFITFAPAQITGLSGRAEPNKIHPFSMSGNLTIRGVTRPVAWEGGVMALNEGELRIEAHTKVKRSDYQISVPNLPFIANVADEVALEFKGAARAVAGQ